MINLPTSKFDFYLPRQLIAQEPVRGARDRSRLMVLDRARQSWQHRHFYELPQFLRAGDLLVFNNSKVFPARLFGKKEGTQGAVEILLLNKVLYASRARARWTALCKGKIGLETRLVFARGLCATVYAALGSGQWVLEFNVSRKKFEVLLARLGTTPIPPYISAGKIKESSLRQKYQTIYAKKNGSVAAPTAGFHFTKQLIARLRARGVRTTEITLYVGLGTFAPVRSATISGHKMHSEYAIVSPTTAAKINSVKKSGGRVIAVGTTTVRTLESFATTGGVVAPGQKWTNIFITPGYKFKIVDAMITNFHLPRSTLLMLVSAFAGRDASSRGGREFILRAYTAAITHRYRFYSFGDAMFIL